MTDISDKLEELGITVYTDEDGEEWGDGYQALSVIKSLQAELARLRPLAELYALAWEECKEWRAEFATYGPTGHAHDKARAERGVGQ